MIKSVCLYIYQNTYLKINKYQYGYMYDNMPKITTNQQLQKQNLPPSPPPQRPQARRKQTSWLMQQLDRRGR